MEQEFALPSGSSIAHYRLVNRIGAGGMGEVYKAQDTTLDRFVALKVLPPELLQSMERVRRFVQEAKSASALNHPNIVTIYEIGQVKFEIARKTADAAQEGTDIIHYIAMEYIDGETLRAKLGRRSPLRPVLEILAQTADGLAKAHLAGIVHRDLKPDNIMITSDGFAKVVDFGLAKLTEKRANENIEHTAEGMIMGTAGYMAPEQIKGGHVDQRADIFAFGCILFEAASGKKPFQSDSAIDTMHKIIFSEHPKLSTVNAAVHPDLEAIVDKCLAKKPEDRYQSIKDVAVDLRKVVQRLGELSERPGMNEATMMLNANAVDIPAPGGEVPQLPVVPAVEPPPAAVPAPAPEPKPAATTPAPRAKKRVTVASILSLTYKLVLLALLGAGVYLWRSYPDLSTIAETPPKSILIEQRLGSAPAEWTPYEGFSPALRRAVMVAVDPNFYDTPKLDGEGLRSAIDRAIKKREFRFTGSKLSRELSANLYIGTSKNPLSPLRERLIAIGLDQKLTKRQILEYYLNVAEFGPNVFGGQAAAKKYFDKPASSLNQKQATLLAAALGNPSEFNAEAPAPEYLDRQKQISEMVARQFRPEPEKKARSKSSRESKATAESEAAVEEDIPEPAGETTPEPPAATASSPAP